MNCREKTIINMVLANINSQMIKDFGGESEYWSKLIYTTEVYKQILNVETKMYLEGTIYLCDCLINELRQKGMLK